MKKQPVTAFTILLAAVICALSALAGSSERHHAPASHVSESMPRREAIAPIANQVNAAATIGIDNPAIYSRIYALSDVHGMYQNLLALLASAGVINASGNWAAGNALLIVVGDSIDKGPQSIETIDLWMSLQNQAKSVGGAVVHLLGNHEAEFLADPQNRKASALLAELAQKNISAEQLTNPAYPRGLYLRTMPLALRVGTWLFCHAGFFPDMTIAAFKTQAQAIFQNGNYADDFIIGPNSILEAKGWWAHGSQTRARLESSLSSNGFTGVVFGHQPAGLNVIGSDAISDDGRLIKIDNGMAPEAGSHPGSLLVFTHPAELTGTAAPTVLSFHSGAHQLTPLPLENPGAPVQDPAD